MLIKTVFILQIDLQSEASGGAGLRSFLEPLVRSVSSLLQFHMVARPKPTFLCRLSAGDHCYLQAASVWSLHTSSNFSGPLGPCHAAVFPFLCSQGKLLDCKDSRDYMGPTWIDPLSHLARPKKPVNFAHHP